MRMEHEALCNCRSNTAGFSCLNNFKPTEVVKKIQKEIPDVNT